MAPFLVPSPEEIRWAVEREKKALRDKFAVAAIQSGEAFNWRGNDYKPVDGLSIIENSARHAYLIADAMLRAREAQGDEA